MVGILLDSVVWSLISLSGCCRFALSSVCVGSLGVLEFSPMVVPSLVGSLLQQVYLCSQLPPNQASSLVLLDATGRGVLGFIFLTSFGFANMVVSQVWVIIFTGVQLQPRSSVCCWASTVCRCHPVPLIHQLLCP